MFLATHRGFSLVPLAVGWRGKYSPCHRICSETVLTILRHPLVACGNEEVNSAGGAGLAGMGYAAASRRRGALACPGRALACPGRVLVTGPLSFSAANWGNARVLGRAGNNGCPSRALGYPSRALVTGPSRGSSISAVVSREWLPAGNNALPLSHGQHHATLTAANPDRLRRPKRSGFVGGFPDCSKSPRLRCIRLAPAALYLSEQVGPHGIEPERSRPPP